MLGTEFYKVPDTDALRVALESQKQKDIDEAVAALKEAGQKFFNKDYNPEVDRKVSKQLIALYARLIPADQRIDIFQTIERISREIPMRLWMPASTSPSSEVRKHWMSS